MALQSFLVMNIVYVLHTYFNVVGIISSIGIFGLVIGYGLGSLVNNKYVTLAGKDITKTSLYKYIENFTTKKYKFLDKKTLRFFLFLLKT